MDLPENFNGSEFLDRWIAALRSGTYTQGRGRLRTEDGFCCLGVACDVFNPLGWDQPAYLDSYLFVEGEDRLRNHMPLELWDKLPIWGITQINLMDFNDQYNYTFSEIAKLLEAHRTDR